MFPQEIIKMPDGQVLFNGKLLNFADLPIDRLLNLFLEQYRTDKKINSNDAKSFILSFLSGYAKDNGFVFPAIPPETFIDKYIEENTYYIYEEARHPKKHIVKTSLLPTYAPTINNFVELARQTHLYTEKEIASLMEKVKNTTFDREFTEYISNPILDGNGNKVIDETQQNGLIYYCDILKDFYSWFKDESFRIRN